MITNNVPYPLRLVLFVMMEIGTWSTYGEMQFGSKQVEARTSGYLAIVASYTMKTTRPTRPRTNGTSTVAESHGAVIPPHVNPMVYATVLAITRKLPLSVKRR